MPTKKLLGAAALSAALVGGGVAGALIGAPVIATAQNDTPTTTATAGSAASTNGDSPDCAFGHRGFGPPGFGVAAEALGISEDDLHTALADGKSIADIADERNIDIQKVIDALVADATAHIDDAVANGDLDTDRAAEIKDGLEERITALVNNAPGFGPPGLGPHSFGPPGLGPAGLGPHDPASVD